MESNVKKKKLFHAHLPSLENLCALSVALTLWRNDLNHVRNEEELRSKSETRLTIRANQLHLPKMVKDKILILIKQISEEAHTWCSHTYDTSFIDISWSDYRILQKVVWTNVGTISQRETALSLINSPLLISDEKKYAIACDNCIAETIYELTPEVVDPEYVESIIPCYQPLVYFWSSLATGDMFKLNRYSTISMYTVDGAEPTLNEINLAEIEPEWNVQVALRRTRDGDVELVNEGNADGYYTMVRDMLCKHEVYMNESAYAYFWKRLPKERRYETYFDPGAVRHPHSVLRQMDEEEQHDFFTLNARYIIRDCLASPLEVDYILEVIHRATKNNPLNVDVYGALGEIIKKLNDFRLTPAYHGYLFVLKRFLTCIPTKVRFSILNDEGVPDVLAYLTPLADKSSVDMHACVIKLLLEGADTELQMKVFNSDYGKYFSMIAIKKNRWNVLDRILPAGIDLFDIEFTNVQIFSICRLIMDETRESVSTFEFDKGVRETVMNSLVSLQEMVSVLGGGGGSSEQKDEVRSIFKEYWRIMKAIL